MNEKALWVCLPAYNLIRLLMTESAFPEKTMRPRPLPPTSRGCLLVADVGRVRAALRHYPG